MAFLEENEDAYDSLRDGINKTQIAVEQYETGLRIARIAGLDLAASQRFLAEEFVKSMGGLDELKGSLLELPTSLRDAVAALRAEDFNEQLAREAEEAAEAAAMQTERLVRLINPLGVAMVEYSESLRLAGDAGLDLETTQAALAEQVISSLGGAEEFAERFADRMSELPPIFEETIERMRQEQIEEDRLKLALRERAKTIREVSDAIGDAVVGTKSWGDAFKDLISNMLRTRAIQPFIDRIADTLFGAVGKGGKGGGFGIGDIFSGIGNFFGGFRERGGPTAAGMAYLVGEGGPELFVPDTSGSILPNDRIGGDTNVTVYTPDANSFMASRRQVARAAKRSLAFGSA